MYPTADTLGSLIDEVIVSLQGFGTDNDQVCTLMENLDATALTFPVDDSTGISRGLVEIDDEVLYVLDSENGQVTVARWGRGFKGTGASAHTAGSPVYVAPSWPRAVVAREINNTIRSVYPGLFAVATIGITLSTIKWQYELPADVDRVLAVEANDLPLNGWQPVTGWEMTTGANTTDFPSGKFLSLPQTMWGNARVHVTYAKAPSLLTATGDLFTATGLPASCHDLIVLGTASRLLPWQDTARVSVETVPSDAQDQQKAVGYATQLGQSLRQQYNLRLADERRALLERYPTRTHRIR